jgi:hypothetical protein
MAGLEGECTNFKCLDIVHTTENRYYVVSLMNINYDRMR